MMAVRVGPFALIRPVPPLPEGHHAMTHRNVVSAAWAVMVACVASACAAPAAEPPGPDRAAMDKLRAGVEEARLRRHVEFLAAPTMFGRRPGSRESEQARAYIVTAFKECGLRPFFPVADGGAGDGGGKSYTQAFKADKLPDGGGVNIAGVLPADSADADIVAVIAHYDHLGRRGGKTYAGADDNASSVAILLETARLAASHKGPRRCHLLFLCPDGEEWGLLGSAAFAAKPPVPLGKFRAVIVMDLMGTDAGPAVAGRLMVLGSEHSPPLARLATAVPGGPRAEPTPLSIGMVEAVPFAPWTRQPVSDYDAFRNAGRPFVFLSCGRSSRYHTPEDTPETLNYPKMSESAGYLLELALRTAALPEAPTFVADPERAQLVVDIATLRKAQEKLLAGDPARYSPKVFEAIGKDLKTLTAMAGEIAALPAGELPGKDKVRAVQMIALRLQVAVWMPQNEAALGF
jgi:hypothetical protein